MKYCFILFLAVFSFSACQNSANQQASETTEEPTDSGESQDDPDLVAITETIHNFYQWYEDNFDELNSVEYVNHGGKHLTLNNAKVDEYFAKVLKSGYISEEYVKAEKAYMKKCEAVWQKEAYEDGPAPGMDADRFFCAQDWDIQFWTTAPVEVEGLGSDSVKATLSGDEGGGQRDQNFKLKKEGGKWKIIEIECDMGL